ncbi:MAG: hypothetical protein FWC97_04915 [Treponema sp.]|nr:hypothetical protein [Treponema sp.]
MKHAKRKGGAFCAVLTVLLCAMVFISCAGNGYTASTGLGRGVNMTDKVIVGDFSLTVTVNKTEASIGDTVTATVVFKNLGGRDIEAELPDWIAAAGGKSVEDILDVVFVPEGVEWAFVDISFEPRPKILIKSGAEIERQLEYTVTESGFLEIRAGAFFITTPETALKHGVQILSNPIRIRVR